MLSTDVRLRICIIQIILMAFVNIATTCFQFLSCVEVNKQSVLYINGNIQCFTYWQYIVSIFTITWVLPFCFTVYISTRMLRQGVITVKEFYICFCAPICALLYLVKRKACSKNRISLSCAEQKQILAIFEEPFRIDHNKNTVLLWDCILLSRRVIVAAIVVFEIESIHRLCYVSIIVLIFLLHHLITLPYKNNTLNKTETFSLVSLTFLVIVNLFWTFIYSYNLPYNSALETIGILFTAIEDFILLAPFTLLVLYILWSLIAPLLKGCISTLRKKHE